MTTTDVLVQVVPGEPRRRWCDTCNTSAGVEVDLYGLAFTGGPYHLGTLTYCERCDDPTEAARLAAEQIQQAFNEGR